MSSNRGLTLVDILAFVLEALETCQVVWGCQSEAYHSDENEYRFDVVAGLMVSNFQKSVP